MKNEQILHNATLILGDKIQSGTLVLEDGCISAIDDEHYSGNGGIDCQGDYLMPGN